MIRLLCGHREEVLRRTPSGVQGLQCRGCGRLRAHPWNTTPAFTQTQERAIPAPVVTGIERQRVADAQFARQVEDLIGMLESQSK